MVTSAISLGSWRVTLVFDNNTSFCTTVRAINRHHAFVAGISAFKMRNQNNIQFTLDEARSIVSPL